MTARQALAAVATGLAAALVAAAPLAVRDGALAPVAVVGALGVVDGLAGFHPDRATPDLPSPSDRRLALASGLAVLAAIWLAVSLPGGGAPAIGAALAAAGVTLRASAVMALGPRFATEIRTHARRVVTGPYRWVQHPGEIGLLAALTGVAAATGSVPAMAANVLVVAPLAVARMRREDRAWEQVPPG